jgi:hypothetical protein
MALLAGRHGLKRLFTGLAGPAAGDAIPALTSLRGFSAQAEHAEGAPSPSSPQTHPSSTYRPMTPPPPSSLGGSFHPRRPALSSQLPFLF